MANIDRRKFGASLIGAGLLSALSLDAQAQNLGDTPIRLVVPFAPGGGGDVLGRLFADKLGALMRRPIIVDNKPGGSTTIGTDFVAKSKPDGNTILLSIPLLVQTYYLMKKLPYDPFTDLVPVIDLVRSPLWVAVSTQKTSASNLAELMKEVKSNPKAHAFGSIGNGSTSHILGNHLNKVAGVEMLHVPYRGSAQVSMALAAGEVTMCILDLVTLGPLLPTGKIKLIGVTGAERTPLSPEVATLTEQGYPGFEIPTWAGFFVPKNTPRNQIQALHEASLKIMAMPDVQSRLKDLGYVKGGSSTEEFQKLVDQERGRWEKMIKGGGIEM